MKGAMRRSKAKSTTTRTRSATASGVSATRQTSLSSVQLTNRSGNTVSRVAAQPTASFSRAASRTSVTTRKTTAATAQKRNMTSFNDVSNSVSTPVVNTHQRTMATVAPATAAVAFKAPSPVATTSAVSFKRPSRQYATVAPVKMTIQPKKMNIINNFPMAKFAASIPTISAGMRKFATEAPPVKRDGYITLNFTTPEGNVIPKSAVHMFEVSTVEGDMGVITDHSPFIGELRPGVVKVFTEPGDVAKKWFVPGGFMLIKQDSYADVTASEAIPVEELDADAARKTLEQANLQLAQATDELAKAEATITIEVCNAIINAAE